MKKNFVLVFHLYRVYKIEALILKNKIEQLFKNMFRTSCFNCLYKRPKSLYKKWRYIENKEVLKPKKIKEIRSFYIKKNTILLFYLYKIYKVEVFVSKIHLYGKHKIEVPILNNKTE